MIVRVVALANIYYTPAVQYAYDVELIDRALINGTNTLIAGAPIFNNVSSTVITARTDMCALGWGWRQFSFCEFANTSGVCPTPPFPQPPCQQP